MIPVDKEHFDLCYIMCSLCWKLAFSVRFQC